MVNQDAASEIKPRKKQKIKQPVRTLFIFSMIIVPIVSFAVFYLYVNFNSFAMAFQMIKGNGKVEWTIDNFAFFFNEFSLADSDLPEAIGNTLMTFALNLVTALGTSFFISYFLYKKITLAPVFKVLMFLPAIISPVVLTRLYGYMVGAQGPIMKMFEAFGMEHLSDGLLGDSRTAQTAVLGYVIWTSIAGNMILFNGALGRIPAEIIEAGEIDGAGWLTELFRIIMPLIWPTMTTLIVLALVGLANASGPVMLMTQGENGTNTLSYMIFMKVYAPNGSENLKNEAAAWGLVFSAVVIPLVFIVRYLLNKKFQEIEY